MVSSLAVLSLPQLIFQEQEHRKSVVADKLRSQLGEQRFAILQEAIGRAPGPSPSPLFKQESSHQLNSPRVSCFSAQLNSALISSYQLNSTQVESVQLVRSSQARL